MRTIVLVIAGLALVAIAFWCLVEARKASSSAEYWRTHPDEAPSTGQDREARIFDDEAAADRNRIYAMVSVGVGLLLCAGGVMSFMRGGRRDGVEDKRKDPIEKRIRERVGAGGGGGAGGEPARRFESITEWAKVALAKPVQVRYAKRFAVLFGVLMVFFVGMAVAIVAANGFTGAGVVVLPLIVVFAVFLYFILSRGLKRAVHTFDATGVTLGDKRRFDWSDFKSVDYRVALKPGGAEEWLWRVELAFAGGEAWIIPQRVVNLDEINDLVLSIPGEHRRG